jgi:hypothetical protein
MIRDAAAIFAANACFLAAGVGVSRLLGLWSAPRELPRVLGIAYMVGVAVIGVLATLGLIGGLALTAWQVLAACFVLAALGFVRRGGALAPGLPVERGARLLVAGIGALLGIYLAALLLRSYAEPLRHWDAWSFWTAKARAIVTLGGLDSRYFAGAAYQTFHRDYPLFVPSLEAIDFRFMGRITTQVIHLQFWCLLAGFLAAAAQLARDRVHPLLVWPALLLVAVSPSMATQLGWAIAELPLAFFFALAALAGWRYVEDGDWRYAALLGVFAAASLATKREAIPFAAALFLLLIVFAFVRRTRIPPLAWAAAAALVGVLPWRIWVAVHHVGPKELPLGKSVNPGWLLGRTERLPPAIERLAIDSVRPGAWIVILPLAVLAAVFALRRGRGDVGAFLLALLALMFLSLIWAYWADLPEIQGHTRRTGPRVVTTAVVLAGVFLPLLGAGLGAAQARARRPARRGTAARPPRASAPTRARITP